MLGHPPDVLFVTDDSKLRSAIDKRRAHLDEYLAQRLYARLCRRPILLTRTVQAGIRTLVAEWLQRDGLVLACTVHVSLDGRRRRNLAQAFTPEQWRRQSSGWGQSPVPFMRIESTTTRWPDCRAATPSTAGPSRSYRASR